MQQFIAVHTGLVWPLDSHLKGPLDFLALVKDTIKAQQPLLRRGCLIAPGSGPAAQRGPCQRGLVARMSNLVEKSINAPSQAPHFDLATSRTLETHEHSKVGNPSKLASFQGNLLQLGTGALRREGKRVDSRCQEGPLIRAIKPQWTYRTLPKAIPYYNMEGESPLHPSIVIWSGKGLPYL